jgi:outer membrane protein assembly factor BamB/tetratricopeptide (TPR) repeat protein
MDHPLGRTSVLFWLLVIAAGCLSSSAPAQNVPGRGALPGESRATAGRLVATDKLVADKQWSEAIDEYMHILEEAGDELVPLDSGHYLSARYLCHERLAALPAEALRLYRDRVESQAKKWFEQGKAEHEPRWLRRLVDEAFCSRYTDRALDLLGDLAFERGRFEEAESWWSMLVPLDRLAGAESSKPRQAKEGQGALAGASRTQPRPPTHDLVYPDPQVEMAKVHAKHLLCQLFAGHCDHWLDDVKVFRKLHENAQGELAGQKGKYADILESWFKPDDFQKTLNERKNQPQPWSTFAGDSSRSFIAPQAPRRLDYENPPWPIRLADRPAGMEGLAAARRARLTPVAPSQPPFFPVVTGNWVLVAGPRSVTAYDLLTARRVGQFDLPDDVKAKAVDDRFFQASADARYTLTVADNRIYARLGSSPKLPVTPSDVLVCLDLPPSPDGTLHLRWRYPVDSEGREDKESVTVFEGSPVVSDGQVFIARTRADSGVTAIECHDAETGKLHWSRDVCQVLDVFGHEFRQPQHLLTLAGSNLFYNTGAGVIVALDSHTGRRLWAYRYSSRGLKTENGDASPRGMSPAVYDSGSVYVAPADFDGLLCLDARTGEKLWERKGIEVVHMLGVAKGKLIVTTAKTDHWPAGIRALEAVTGAEIRGWIQPDDGSSLLSYGRGFLAGDWVFWPIIRNTGAGQQRELLILNQDDGQPAVDATQFWQVRAGNMALGNDCLAIADDEYLSVYVPPARLLQLRENQAKTSGSATATYLWGVALSDAGQASQALEAFAQAAKMARPEDVWNGMPLRDQIRADWHRYLLALAKQASSETLAEAYFKHAATPEFTVSQRLQALARQADVLSRTNPDRAVAVWQEILQDDSLRRGWLTYPNGSVYPARWRAVERINQLTGDKHQAIGEHSKAAVVGILRVPTTPTWERELKSEAHALPAASEPHWLIPLAPSWQIDVDRSEKFLDAFLFHGANIHCIFTCCNRELICRDSLIQKPRWTQKVIANPTWVASYTDAVLLAGSEGLNLLNLSDGRVLWEFIPPPVPSTWPENNSGLNQFRIVGSVLIFLQGQRRLLALDVETGRLLWQRLAPGAALPTSDGTFESRLLANERGVLVQTSNGRLWILNLHTGQLQFDGVTSRSPWPRSPFPVDEERVLLVPDDQNMMLLSMPTGKVLWKKTAGQPSITLAAPQFLAEGQIFYQLTDGCRLARLNLSNGQILDEKFIANDPIDAELSALDSARFYFVAQDRLRAWSLTDGRPLWDRPLPCLSVPWRVVASGKYLFLFPSQSPWTLRFGFFLTPQPVSFPVEMQWDSWPLIICDKRTGEIVQEMRFPGTGFQARVHFSNQTLIAALDGKIQAFQPQGVR